MRVEARLVLADLGDVTSDVRTAASAGTAASVGTAASAGQIRGGQIAQAAWFTFSFLADADGAMQGKAIEGKGSLLNDSGGTSSLVQAIRQTVAVHPETAVESEWVAHAKRYNGQ